MHYDYADILALTTKRPLWFDKHGCPRFVPHHPKHSPDIYAAEVVLLRIACQNCHREIDVQMTWSTGDTMHMYMISNGERQAEVQKISQQGWLRTQIENKSIHYGDPPAHNCPDTGDYCHAGCTMNCYDLKVLEYWSKKQWEWKREPELEVELEAIPDDADYVP